MLGEGAFGSAWLASHPVLKMPVIIKTFHSSRVEDIFQEAQLAARIQSPHVVSVLDAGVEKDIPFVVQSYIDGVDLRELIRYRQRSGHRLPTSFVCRVIGEAARGLHAVHQAGIVHRDVKPANLFLSGSGTAVVGDFGIAIDVGLAAHVVAGTPAFMAPEQWAQGTVDRRVDIYSLGATAHCLLTGEAPSAGGHTPPSASTGEEAFLLHTVSTALHKDPARRYPSGLAFATDLATITRPDFDLTALEEERAVVGPVTVELKVGDLADERADVLVNAANTVMAMDMGVARALRKRAGGGLARAAESVTDVRMGDVVWTGAFRLDAKWVAHAVAAYQGAVCIQRTVLRTLLEAEVRRVRSVAFPALGGGVGRVPMALVAERTLRAIRTFATLEPKSVREVRIVLYPESIRAVWTEILQGL